MKSHTPQVSKNKVKEEEILNQSLEETSVFNEKELKEEVVTFKNTLAFPLKLRFKDYNSKKIIDAQLKSFKMCANEGIKIMREKVYINLKKNPITNHIGICPLCSASSKNKKILPFLLKNFEMVVGEKVKKKEKFPKIKKGSTLNVCECIFNRTTIRKFIQPSSTHTTQFDFTSAGSLNKKSFLPGEMSERGGGYPMCLDKLSENLKSQYEINKKIDNDIDFQENIKEFNQLYIKGKLNNEKSLEFKKFKKLFSSSKKIEKRIEIIDKLKDKYNNQLTRKLTKRSTKEIIDVLTPLGKEINKPLFEINKLKNMKAGGVEIKSDTVRLDKGHYKFEIIDGELCLLVKDYVSNKFITIGFHGASLNKDSSKGGKGQYWKYHKRLMKTIGLKSGVSCEIVKYDRKHYSFQYVYSKEEEIKYPIYYKCPSCNKKEFVTDFAKKTFYCKDRKCTFNKEKRKFTQENLIIEEGATPIGIDLGILNLASTASINDKNYFKSKNNPKIENISFFNGRGIRSKRQHYNKIRRIWNIRHIKRIKRRISKFVKKYGDNAKIQSLDTQLKSCNWLKDKNKNKKELRFMKWVNHQVSFEIVEKIIDAQKRGDITKPIIVLENLKYITFRQDKIVNKLISSTKNKLKGKQQELFHWQKKLIREINNWNFAQLQSYIIYKANWLGIPVIHVSAKNTSIKCNKCGYVDEDNYENYHTVNFKCKKCGYKCNADFNASVNLCKDFFGLKNPISSTKPEKRKK